MAAKTIDYGKKRQDETRHPARLTVGRFIMSANWCCISGGLHSEHAYTKREIITVSSLNSRRAQGSSSGRYRGQNIIKASPKRRRETSVAAVDSKIINPTNTQRGLNSIDLRRTVMETAKLKCLHLRVALGPTGRMYSLSLHSIVVDAEQRPRCLAIARFNIFIPIKVQFQLSKTRRTDTRYASIRTHFHGKPYDFLF